MHTLLRIALPLPVEKLGGGLIMSGWIKTLSLNTLSQKQRTVFRFEGKQIALFLTKTGVLACNNRCPHEGYPLREGTLDDACVLTCHWHNWKFDLTSGANLFGGDRLRIYPTDVRAGEIWLDLSEPSFEARQSELMANLRQAFDDNDYERIARELARIQLLGADPAAAIIAAINWSYDRLEFGWTHAYAGAADWLALYDEYNDPEIQLICVLETIAHIADDVVREAVYSYSENSLPYAEDGFAQAIETENETTAIALLRGALNEGLHFTDLEPALTQAALKHYNDFGHSLIYLTKAGYLIERLGTAVELPLLLSLVRNLIYATREDQIPEFRGYQEALKQWGKNDKTTAPTALDYQGLTIDKALQLTAYHSKASHDSLYAALLGANAANMLRYDMRYQNHIDRPVSDNVGWLSFTHGITFANAVRLQCEKFPELWPAGLLQMACFSGRNTPFTDRGLKSEQWQVSDSDAFFKNSLDALFDHGKEEFIVSVHLLKTLLAARTETRQAAVTDVAVAIPAAVNRFLHSPLKRKHVRRTARQAMAFVAKDR